MWKVHRERENLLFIGSLSKRPRQLGLCPSKARRPELQLALPHGGQAPQIVGPVFIVFPYALSGSLSGSRLAGTWTSTPVWDKYERHHVGCCAMAPIPGKTLKLPEHVVNLLPPQGHSPARYLYPSHRATEGARHDISAWSRTVLPVIRPQPSSY